MKLFIWLLTAAVVLSACTSSPAPSPNNPTPQPLVLDSFAANPNPSPINLGVQFSWSILGGGNKTCKLDVNNDGTFEYTLNGCDSTSKQSHVYSGVGTYTAKLVVSDGSSTLEKTTSVGVIAENRKPNVVELIAQQTTNPLRVRWVFKVSDAEGDVLTCKLDVNNDGEAEFVFTPCNSNALNSSISTANSILPSAAIDSILSSSALNSSNPKTPSNTGGAIEYTYPAKGTYTAKLEVSDAYNSVSSTRSVNVPVSPEVLEFTANPTTLIAKDSTTFAFKVNSPNSLPLKCILTTGDGSTFTFDPCPSNVVLKQNYTYMEAGKYTATLSVQDSLGNISTRNLALNIAPIRFTQVSTGAAHTCAIANNQKTYCWGDNLYGQLGNGNNTDANTPQAVLGGQTFTQISSGEFHTCALTSTRQAYCWGRNSEGQLGNGNNTNANTPQAVDISGLPTGTPFSQISTGGYHACGLTSAGQAYCWGYNIEGHLGNGNNTDANTPQPVSGVLAFSQISAGGSFTCALTPTGQAYCWGSNFFGQLGNGNTGGSANTPQLVSMPLGVVFSQIRPGGVHACALTPTGQAYCWGWNARGQLGNGNNTTYNTPQLVSGGHTFSQISAGFVHTCALTPTGQAYCWGRNNFGELGNGDNTGANTPQPVSGVLAFSQIWTGSYYACGLASAGQAYCWGYNIEGQLGNGNNTNANTPQPVVMP